MQEGTTGWHGTDADTGAAMAADAAGKKVEVAFVSAKELAERAKSAAAAAASAEGLSGHFLLLEVPNNARNVTIVSAMELAERA